MSAPDRLAGALSFTTSRFVAVVAELDAARAKLAAVEAALRLPGMTGPACSAREAYDDLHRRVRIALGQEASR